MMGGAAEHRYSPAWIAAERWAALPVMLRAALAGAALIDGEVRGRVPYLTGLLSTRYAREVADHA
jgi:hypothetical protein